MYELALGLSCPWLLYVCWIISIVDCTQWRKLDAEFGGRKFFFCHPPNWETWGGGRRGTHCILELNVG